MTPIPANAQTLTSTPRRRRVLLRSAIALALIGTGVTFAGAAPTATAAGTPTSVIIDDFSVNQNSLFLTYPPGGATTFSSQPGAGLGGERDMALNLDDGGIDGNGIGVRVAFNSVIYAQDPTIHGSAMFSWDGNDASPVLNTSGLGGVDLTGGGTQDALRLTVAWNTEPANVSLTVYTDGTNYASYGMLLPGTVTSSTDYVIPFSSFFPNGGTVDFADVGAISLTMGSPIFSPSIIIDSLTTTSLLTADMTDTLAVDGNGNGLTDEGDVIRYSVIIGNHDDATAAAAEAGTFVAPINPGSTLVAGSVTATSGTVTSGNTVGDTAVGVSFPAIADDISETITFDVIVGPFSGNISNQGVVAYGAISFDTDDPDVAGTGDPTVTAVLAPTDVAVTTSGPANADAGDTITYALTITNNGPFDADNVTFTDTIPAGTTFVSFVQTSGPAANVTTPAPGGTGSVDGSIAFFPSGATMTFAIQVHVDDTVTAGTILEDTASATTTSNDINLGNNNSASYTEVSANVDLAITKIGPASAHAGDELTYDVTVTNNGPDDAADVTITDTIPAGTTFVSFVQNTGPTANATTPPSGGNGTITATIAMLASSSTMSFSIVVNVDAVPGGTTIANTASVTTSSTDTNADNNTSNATTSIDATVDLAIGKALVGSLTAGAAASYTLTASNDGPDTATGTITVTDVLPNSLSYVSAAGAGWVCVETAGTVTCTADTDLADGATSVITLNVTVAANATGSIANTASVASGEFDAAGADDSDTASAAVAPTPPTTTPDPPAPTVPGTDPPVTTTPDIAPPATPPAPVQAQPQIPPTGDLPATGSNLLGPAGLAVLLVIVGLVAVVVGTRRRSHANS